MKPTNEGCAWCGRPATFKVRFSTGGQFHGQRFACDLHISDARRTLLVVRVEAVEVPS